MADLFLALTRPDDTEPSAEAMTLLHSIMKACGQAGACTAAPCACAADIDRFRAAGVREEREKWLDCASVDPLMEGPRLKCWNRTALNRRWEDTHDQ